MRTPSLRTSHSVRTSLRTLVATGLVAAVAVAGQASPRPAEPAGPQLRLAAGNPVTPGDFTGYGFDQCEAPSQYAMDQWLQHSPYLAVGIYISGNSRACRTQANLTPTWVATQLKKDWRLLPITLGPQASCSTRYPKYGWSIDPTISPNSTNNYAKARSQARVTAEEAVAAAQRLGIPAGSTLFYDLEAFDITQYHCRESAIRFVHAWTNKLHALGYQSGFYSSAGSGIKMLDDVRVHRPGRFSLPDYIWLARWDGVANTSTETRYLREDGWQPHRRVKQYRGGHDETYGGVTINIDTNYLDVGRGSYAPPVSHCDGTRVDFGWYPKLSPGATHATVRALKCFLSEQGYGDGVHMSSYYGSKAVAAAKRWKADHGFSATATWYRPNWQGLLSQGSRLPRKFGSAGEPVRRIQRALNSRGARLEVTGVYDAATAAAVRDWQSRAGLTGNGIMSWSAWGVLQSGR